MKFRMKVWRDIADMNLLECGNKLMTYRSWFTSGSPLLDHWSLMSGTAPSRFTHSSAEWGCPPNTNSLSAPRPPQARHEECEQVPLACAYSRCVILHLVRWQRSLWQVLPELLFKLRCMFFFTVKTCLCALSESGIRSSFHFASPFLWRPLMFCMPCNLNLYALPSQTVFDFLSRRHNKFTSLQV